MGGRRVIPSGAEAEPRNPPRLESSPGDAHVVRSGGLLSMTWVAAVSFRTKRLYACYSGPKRLPLLSAKRLPLSFRAKRSGAEESPPGWSQVQEMLTSSAAADSSA